MARQLRLRHRTSLRHPWMVLILAAISAFQCLHPVEGGGYGYIRGGRYSDFVSTIDSSRRGTSTALELVPTTTHHEENASTVSPFQQYHRHEQEDSLEVVLNATIPSQVPKTYVFPMSLNTDCASGASLVVGVSQLHNACVSCLRSLIGLS